MRATSAALLIAAVGTVAACNVSTSDPQAAAPTTPIINNITPSGDNGTGILLALAGTGLLVFVVIAVVASMCWWNERNRRVQVEDAFTAVTGQPINRASALAYRYAPALPTGGLPGQTVPSVVTKAMEVRR